jgi:hypothetical protein
MGAERITVRVQFVKTDQLATSMVESGGNPDAEVRDVNKMPAGRLAHKMAETWLCILLYPLFLK